MKISKLISHILFYFITLISFYLGFTYIKSHEFDKLILILILLLLLLVPYYLNKKLDYKIKDEVIILYLLFVSSSIILGTLHSYYLKVPFFDKVIHFISGILSSILALIILKNFSKDDNLGITIFFMSATTALVAVVWEVIEYTYDLIFLANTQRVLETGINDTMLDMIMALLGFAFWAIYYYIKKRCDE